MKAAPFVFVRPGSLAEALAAYAAAAGEAKLIAGGQSLAPMMNLRLAAPKTLIDIHRLEELQGVADQGDQYAIGAAVTHAALEDRAYPLADQGMLQAIAGGIAYRAVRNRGTIGGSLAHADPAADWVTALTAIGAKISLRTPAGPREETLPAFFRGAFTTALEPHAIIAAILIPKFSPDARWGYYKACRKTGEFAEAIGAVVLDPGRGFARVVAGALNGAPVLLPALAERVAALGAAAVSREAVFAALAEAAPDLDRVAQQLHATAVRRALDQALRP